MGRFRANLVVLLIVSVVIAFTWAASPDLNNILPCLGKVCQQHANCVVRNGLPECVCDIAWTGANCDEDVDECALDIHKCPAGQICSNRSPGYSCSTAPDPIADTLCPAACGQAGKSHGACVRDVCVCQDGYHDSACTTPPGECSLECTEGGHGECLEDGECACSDGYTGTECTVELVRIEPMRHHGIPTDPQLATITKMPGTGAAYVCVSATGHEPGCDKDDHHSMCDYQVFDQLSIKMTELKEKYGTGHHDLHVLLVAVPCKDKDTPMGQVEAHYYFGAYGADGDDVDGNADSANNIKVIAGVAGAGAGAAALIGFCVMRRRRAAAATEAKHTNEQQTSGPTAATHVPPTAPVPTPVRPSVSILYTQEEGNSRRRSAVPPPTVSSGSGRTNRPRTPPPGPRTPTHRG